MFQWVKQKLAPDLRQRFISHVPSGLILALGYAFTAALFFYPGRGLPRHDHFGYLEIPLAIIMTLFALWHSTGYLGYIAADQARKVGYLFSAVFLTGFSTLLFSDGSYLSGGYVGLGVFVATYSYWRYPRRHECGST